MNQMNELVLPSFFTDNYFTLLPGDEKQVEVDISMIKSSFKHDDLKLVMEGWNVLPFEIKW